MQQDATLDSIRSDPSDDDLHICPCRPEVHNQGPGLCSECGMALEPKRPRGFAPTVMRYICTMHVKDRPVTIRFDRCRNTAPGWCRILV